MVDYPKWARDELILALDLYFRVDFANNPRKGDEIFELSQLLKQLPIHPREYVDDKFRNANSVHMKLSNFQSLDPTYIRKGLKGLTSLSKLDNEMWNEFASDRVRLRMVASLIREQYKSYPTQIFEQLDSDDEEEFVEGRILTRLHSYHERKVEAARAKKRSVKQKTGALVCEVCGFDFYQTYGQLGDDFAECHHKIPVAELKPGQTTKIKDLAIVCANCHRMLHRGKLKISMEELRKVVHERRSN